MRQGYATIRTSVPGRSHGVGCDHLYVAHSCLRRGMKDTTVLNDAFLGRPHLPSLSPREIEVMDYMVQRLSNKEIAEAAGITTGTVTSHITNIRAKLRIVRKGRPALIAAYLATRELSNEA